MNLILRRTCFEANMIFQFHSLSFFKQYMAKNNSWIKRKINNIKIMFQQFFKVSNGKSFLIFLIKSVMPSLSSTRTLISLLNIFDIVYKICMKLLLEWKYFPLTFSFIDFGKFWTHENKILWLRCAKCITRFEFILNFFFYKWKIFYW